MSKINLSKKKDSDGKSEYYFNILLPKVEKDNTRLSIFGKSDHVNIELNTCFMLTHSDYHVLIRITLLGFGLEFFVRN